MPHGYHWCAGDFHICNSSPNISLHRTLLPAIGVEVKTFPSSDWGALDCLWTWNQKTLASEYILIEYILCDLCKFNDKIKNLIKTLQSCNYLYQNKANVRWLKPINRYYYKMFTFSDSWELSTSHCQTRLKELEQQVYFIGGWYFKPELVVLLRLHLKILSNSEPLLLTDY